MKYIGENSLKTLISLIKGEIALKQDKITAEGVLKRTPEGNIEAVTIDKNYVGLGKVGNFKSVSTEADQSLTDVEKTTARTNIGAGTYSKPSTGIPKADCSAEVQASLAKADSAAQTSQIITLTAALEDGSTKTYKLYGYEVTE